MGNVHTPDDASGPPQVQPGRWYSLPDGELVFCQLSSDGSAERRMLYDRDARPRFMEGTSGEQRGRILALVDAGQQEGLAVVISDLDWSDLAPALSPLRHFFLSGTIRTGGREWPVAQAVHCERATLPNDEQVACVEIARRMAKRLAPDDANPDVSKLRVQEDDGTGFFFGRLPAEEGYYMNL